MDGVLVVNKPAGFTSHDVVARVRRRFGVRRVGHAGTLDPMAEGVLLLLTGRATRLSEFASGHRKKYRAGLLLGITTDTLDSSGRVTGENSAAAVTEAQLREMLEQFRGNIAQTPPMYSAVKVGGKRLYKMAREGRTVERQPREVTVTGLEMGSWQGGERARATLEMDVSSGFYVRTLCSDIGERLGVGGCMEWLVRTASGPFTLDQSATLDEIEAWSSQEFRDNLLPLEAALVGIPRVDLDQTESRRFCSGMAVQGQSGQSGIVRVHGSAGELLGIGRVQDEASDLRPVKVLSAT